MNPATTNTALRGPTQRTDLVERKLEGELGGSRAVDVLEEGPAAGGLGPRANAMGPG